MHGHEYGTNRTGTNAAIPPVVGHDDRVAAEFWSSQFGIPALRYAAGRPTDIEKRVTCVSATAEGRWREWREPDVSEREVCQALTHFRVSPLLPNRGHRP